MHKKRVLLCLFSVLLMSSAAAFAFDINAIHGSVCSEGTIQVQPGGEAELCLQFSNDGDASLGVKYKFIGAQSNEYGVPVCGLGNPFDIFFPDKSERVIFLSGHASQQIREKIFAPLGATGFNFGCIQYGAVNTTIDVQGGGGMFAIDIVRAMYAKIFVGGVTDIKKSVVLLEGGGNVFSTDKKIAATFNTSGLDVSATIKNDGNVVQSVTLKLVVSNFLGFEKDFDPIGVPLDPGQSYTLIQHIKKVPGYKGFFDAELNVVATPKFEFDVSSLGENLYEPITLVVQSTFFIFSWIWLLPLLIVVRVLIKIFFLKKKKISAA